MEFLCRSDYEQRELETDSKLLTHEFIHSFKHKNNRWVRRGPMLGLLSASFNTPSVRSRKSSWRTQYQLRGDEESFQG